MRRYETFVIIDPDLTEAQRGLLSERIQEQITDKNGLLVELDEWGLRKLAYEIRKKDRGHYIRFDYCGTGDLVDELERIIRINDGFLKYMTVVLDKDIDLEAIKEKIREKQESVASKDTPDIKPDIKPDMIPDIKSDTDEESPAAKPKTETPETKPVAKTAETPKPEPELKTRDRETMERGIPAPKKSEEE